MTVEEVSERLWQVAHVVVGSVSPVGSLRAEVEVLEDEIDGTKCLLWELAFEGPVLEADGEAESAMDLLEDLALEKLEEFPELGDADSAYGDTSFALTGSVDLW